MIKICKNCKHEFKGRKERTYCSRACKHLCSEYRKSVSEGNVGKTLGRPLGYSIAGEKNPRWISDRSKLKTKRGGVEKFLLDAWRKQIYERDDYRCQKCGVRGGRLNADHIKPVLLFPELAITLENGRTLCTACHRKTPTFGSKVLKLKREDFEKGGYLYS